MNTIFILFMVLLVIASVLLVIMVMAQNPKGGGLSGTFGGTSPAQFGVQRTNDFMEKATWSLGGVIVVLCMLSVILTANPAQVNATKANSSKAKTEQNTAPIQKTEPVKAPATK